VVDIQTVPLGVTVTASILCGKAAYHYLTKKAALFGAAFLAYLQSIAIYSSRMGLFSAT